MTLKDQVALVTGGSRGIGRAVVQKLAAEGAKVAFVYRGSQAAAEELEKAVTASGGTAKAIQADVADPAAARRVVDQVLADWGRVDILVNNAGVIRDGLFIRMEPENWQTVIDTNLNGTFYFCKAVADQMALKQRSGRIINVSSVAADHVNAGQTNYAASKAGVIGMVRALAPRAAERGVTVNAVAPGFIETEMTARMPVATREAARRINSLRQGGLPVDVAETVAWLGQVDSGGVTGQAVRVCGQSMVGA